MLLLVALLAVSGVRPSVAQQAELLLNTGFESLTGGWDCPAPITCTLSDDAHSGQHAFVVTNRQADWQGPTQNVNLTSGQAYQVSAWLKLLKDQSRQNLFIMADIADTTGQHVYLPAASHSPAHVSDGWVHLSGGFTAPDKPLQSARIYFQSGPDASVSFAVDEASMIVMPNSGHATKADMQQTISQIRKSDIILNVTTSQNIMKGDVRIHVLQKRKSFPFGTAVRVSNYIDEHDAVNLRYRAFVHDHFNWIVPENALKWYSIEPGRGNYHWNGPKMMIDLAHKHGMKIRGHCLLWSVENYVHGWVRGLTGQDLRDAITAHVIDTFNHTRGQLEHWDVNNEMLHGQWYQDTLKDPTFNVEFFRYVHNLIQQTDPNVTLFLNDYNVIVNAYSTSDYIAQIEEYKAANVGLGGIGVQSHYASDNPPDPPAVKQRLDMLGQLNLPIWATELDCIAQDENERANRYENALRTLYAHPAVEGIMFWGFWDRAHWKGEAAALVRGDNLAMTAAGRRVFDMMENQWMTDEIHVIPQHGEPFTVRGFHGDYEVTVNYLGHDLTNLTQTFTLEKGQTKRLNIFVHE